MSNNYIFLVKVVIFFGVFLIIELIYVIVLFLGIFWSFSVWVFGMVWVGFVMIIVVSYIVNLVVFFVFDWFKVVVSGIDDFNVSICEFVFWC